MPSDRVKQILFDALDVPQDQRRSFIETACDGDASLIEQVLRLAKAHDNAGEFLSEPSIDTGSKTVAYAEEPLPESIGGRKVLRKLGEGGFGVVYLAQQDKPVSAEVAIKVVRPGMGSQQVIARFETERRALELMKHPCIAGVIDAGTTDDGRPYFVLEHVPGESITAYVNGNNLSTRARLELFEQVCFAVQHAHQKGVIHRDIKPSNVLVTEIDGKPTPKVIDFGIAKAIQGPLSDRTVITQSAQIVGTPQYMSPEQVSFGEVDVDTRSDIYSLGALLYELLTGSPPFESKRLNKAGAAELERIIREENPPKPSTRVFKSTESSSRTRQVARDLRGDLDWVVARAMEKDRSRRYQTPAELGADLRRYLLGEPVEAGPPSGVYRLRKLIARRRVEFAAACSVAMALIAVVIVSVVFASSADRARKDTERELAKFQSISRFTEEMLSGIDPAVARGADTELFRSILDDAAERINTEGIDEPEVEIELRAMIGQAYQSVALFDLSEAQIRIASAMAHETIGGDAALTLEIDSQLAQVLGKTSRLEESLEMFRSIHQRRLTLLGPDHETTIEALSNVGAIQNMLGLYEDSYATQQRVLEARIRTLGDHHEDAMATRNNIATLLDDLNRAEEALPLLQRVLEFQIETNGEDHPQTLATMNNLANAHQSVGNNGEAETLFLRVLDIKNRVLPEGHPSILITLNNLASLLGMTGEPERAIEIFEEAAALSAEHHGDSSIYTLTIRNNLSTNYIRVGRHEEAVALLRLVSEGFLESSGPANPRTIAARTQLATVLNTLGDHEEALLIATESVELAIENLPPNHRLIASANLAFGKAQTSFGRFEEAETALLEAHRIGMLLHEDPSDPRLLEYMEPLRDLYESSGNSVESARWASNIDALDALDKKN